MRQATAQLRLFGELDSFPKDPVDAARFLWSRGHRVIPFLVKAETKHPLIKKWRPYDVQWSDLEPNIRQTSAFGIVVPPGIIIVDLDCKPNEEYCKFIGLDSLIDLSTEHGDDRLAFMDTLTVDTPTGGMHLWYRIPTHIKLKNSASSLGPGIDIRVPDKGLVLMPPSVGHNGERYSFNQFSGLPHIAKAPTWLLQQVVEKSNRIEKVVLDQKTLDMLKLDTPVKIKQYLHQCSSDIVNAPTGARNNTLNAIAYGVYRRVASGRIPEALAEESLYSAAIQTGLSEKEVEATLRSAQRAGALNPR